MELIDMLRNKLLTYFTALAVFSSLQSCEYKGLEEADYVPNSVMLDFSWEKIDSMPASFRIAFYPADESTLKKVPNGMLMFDVYNTKCIISGIPSGTYDISAWNTDTERVIIENANNRVRLMASTTDFSSRTMVPKNVIDSLFYKKTLSNTPDYMAHANVERFYVKPNKQEQPLTIHPDSMVVAVKCNIRGIAGLEIAKEVKGALSNVAKKRLIAHNNSIQDTTAVMFDCSFIERDSLVFSDFYIYGLNADNAKDSGHTLTLFFWLDGKNVFIPISLDKMLANYDKSTKKISIDIPNLGIDLRDFVTTMGGFDVNVGEWKDEYIDIPW